MKEEYRIFAEAVERQRKLMNSAMDFIWANPEVGYKEWKTSGWLEKRFEELGYQVKRAGDIPGFTAEFDTGRPGPVAAVMGELDALMCATHPAADPETKAVHACGHLIQTSVMLGIAAALKEPGLADGMCGKIRFIAVPAEETIDLAFRESLVKKGVIRYMAGKIEFLRRGFFDGVDMAMMFHVTTAEGPLFALIDGCDGCITKHFEYRGVAAHAGGAPHKGVNALYAASLGLQACNSLRETFQEKDYVRYHPIINQAGVAANAIPDVASLDTYVRAATLEAMVSTNRRINRAIGASAAALGAHVKIVDRPGNLPYRSDKNLTRQLHFLITDLFGEGQFAETGWDTQSTDVGDISSLMPVVQHLCAGAVGAQHGEDFYIADRQKAVMNPALALLCLLYDLLKEEAALARKVIEEYEPVFSDKEEYFAAVDRIGQEKELVRYVGNDCAEILY